MKKKAKALHSETLWAIVRSEHGEVWFCLPDFAWSRGQAIKSFLSGLEPRDWAQARREFGARVAKVRVTEIKRGKES